MKTANIKYSILDLALISRGSSIPQTYNQTVELAQMAEKCGYTRYWLAEHHNMIAVGSSATSILIGKVAENTKTIRVGSGGVMLPNHSPLIVAEQFGTLGHLYPNRIDLGLGRAPGTDRETAQAIRIDFMQAAHSFPRDVDEIKQYFSKENENHKVRATVAEGVDVPIYILGSSTDSAHLAAAKGLPYAFASHFATAQLHDALRIYREEFQPSGDLEKPYTLAGVNVIIAETDAEAVRIATSLIRMFIGILTGQRDYVQPPTAMNGELRGLYEHPALQQMLKYSFIGSRKTVKEQVQEFIQKSQVDELIVVTNTYDHQVKLKSFRIFSEIMEEIHQEMAVSA
ncbi:MAG: LLM class flavin-dependent oxidoreductase [Leeuwenhoekiella sp.]